jgi:CO dehydrogenase/acetyl-CoA synthase gamma subunit (corrinoid Fe-S protein)
MPDADLYIDRIDIDRYLSGDECTRCGARSCRDLVRRLVERRVQAAELRGLDPRKAAALMTATGADGVVPAVPSLQLPRPVKPGVVELNDPSPGAPVLVTGNSEFTQEVLLAVLSTTLSPFFVVFTDTRGDTLDMALILDSFTPERVGRFFEQQDVSGRVGGGTLVLPGLAADLADAVAEVTGLAAEVGPVCAAELPLYFGERWKGAAAP